MKVQLNRARVLAGLAIVLVGTVWATGGADAVRALGGWSLRALPAAVLGLGLVLLIRSLAPRGLIAGPLVLVAVGAAALAVQLGMLPTVDAMELAPLVMVVAGILIAMMPHRSSTVPRPNVERLSAFLTTRRVEFDGTAPTKLIIRSVFGGIHADLTSCTYPGTNVLMVDVTQFAGRVELRLPRAWHVRAGRIELARGVRFGGGLDSAEPPPPGRVGGIPNLVVVNVQGLGGSLTITRTQPVASESGDAGASASPSEPGPSSVPGPSPV